MLCPDRLLIYDEKKEKNISLIMTCSGRLQGRPNGESFILTWWSKVNCSESFFDIISLVSRTKISWWHSPTGQQLARIKPLTFYFWVILSLFKMIRMNIYILYDLEIDQNGIGNCRNGYLSNKYPSTVSKVVEHQLLKCFLCICSPPK